MKVLFICHGNVQRSQMAEGYYNFYTHSHDASSAGVDPLTPKEYQAPHPETINLMAEEGIDVSRQTVKQVTQEMVDEVDVVYLITDTDVPEFVAQSPKVVYWNISDPFLMPLPFVREIQQQVKSHVQEIVPAFVHI